MHIRAKVLAASAIGLSIAGPAPALAQENHEAIVTIMRACSQIEDLSARVMCYDNNIRPGATAPAAGAASVPPAPAPPAPATSAPAAPAPAAPAAPAAAPQSGQARAAPEERREIEGRVVSARERAPGIYALALEDGSEWEFVDSAPVGYDPPRAGSAIRIEPAALGSFRMRYGNQRLLRVRQIR